MQCLCIARLVFGWLSDIGKFAGSVLPSEPELSRHESQKRGGDIMSLANKHPVHTETLDDFMWSFLGPMHCGTISKRQTEVQIYFLGLGLDNLAF